jgi:ATP-dependent Clp protease ATP-binding subunit ClpX
MNTKDILFICGGAFDGLDKIVNTRSNKSGIGFKAKVNHTDDKLNHTKLMQLAEPRDLVAFGLIPEFVGRVPVIAPLHDLSEKDLRTILVEPENALVRQYTELFKMDGINLTIEEQVYDHITALAVENKTGARGLRAIMEKILLEIMYESPSVEGITDINIFLNDNGIIENRYKVGDDDGSSF